MFTNEQYERYRAILRGQRLPLALVDLDSFDANVDLVAQRARGTGKTVRLGTKSLRCEPLLVRALERGAPLLAGFLTYTAEETAWLADKGHDDLLLAYPTVQPGDLEILCRLTAAGKRVMAMVDSLEHLRILAQAGARAGVELGACQGGGYVASGPPDATRAPLPVLPPGLKYLPLEGAGEVSTPLVLPPGCPDVQLGDPIFFQHAKAGELCERFDRLHLLRQGQIVDSVPTYRGEGMNFL